MIFSPDGNGILFGLVSFERDQKDIVNSGTGGFEKSYCLAPKTATTEFDFLIR
jgi:hypothetical protein